MQQNSYEYGYAEYLDANGMTVSVDGRVQISGININDLNMYWWTTDRNWYPPRLDEGQPVVYIIRKENLNQFTDILEKYPDIILEYETDRYAIFTSPVNHTWQ